MQEPESHPEVKRRPVPVDTTGMDIYSHKKIGPDEAARQWREATRSKRGESRGDEQAVRAVVIRPTARQIADALVRWLATGARG